MKAAVLGSPIAHSLSPVLHQAAYRALGLTGWTYQAIECDEAALPALLASRGPDWAGLSLTMPLKRAVLPLLDYLDALAAEVGAANTVVFAAGRRHGHNTDVPGLLAALAERGITGTSLPPHPAVLILGAGATARSALAALRALGITQLTVAARDPARASDLLATADRLGLKITLTHASAAHVALLPQFALGYGSIASAIYVTDKEQAEAAEASKRSYQAQLTAAGRGTITTEIREAPTFYYAEDYHQQYLAKNPNGYCGIGGCGVPFKLAEVAVGEKA